MQEFELIGKLIEIALVQCQDVGVIDWYPGDGEPETFQAECEIEWNVYTSPWTGDDFFVTVLENPNIHAGVFCIIDTEHLECWHASKIGDQI